MQNIWIGLIKGDTSVAPEAKAIGSAGYEVAGIEPTFILDSRSCNPDLLLTSESEKQTILIEASCSRAKPSRGEWDRKCAQFAEYDKVTSELLVQRAFIPARSAERFEWFFVASGPIVNSAISHLKKRKGLGSVHQVKAAGGGFYSYEVLQGAIVSKIIGKALSKPIRIANIPRYLVVDVREPEPGQLLVEVLRHLAILLMNGKRSFSPEDLARSILSDFDVIPVKFRNPFIKQVQLAVARCQEQGPLKSIIRIKSQSPRRYEVVLGRRTLQSVLTTIRKAKISELRVISPQEVQLPLDLDELED